MLMIGSALSFGKSPGFRVVAADGAGMLAVGGQVEVKLKGGRGQTFPSSESEGTISL